ncbi:1-aminocyclopropane-1-carboxylate deaminase [Flavobacteriaceae bacterium (ex Bugula neritina AB1)]|nr:1-aminocyclopropane-1-carboxylate deaminase [Flavobacteriaceae bacterium (ex Bugula neritina AB1)]
MTTFSWEIKEIENEEVVHPILEDAKVKLFVKREDLLHDHVSGNKFRKLKYNFIEAKKQGFDKVLTFGGAYSNHIAATAAAGKIVGLETMGIIRGEELAKDIENTLLENSTLRFASENGMRLNFIPRASYRNKTTKSFLEKLGAEFGPFYCIPEGGTNELAVQGCGEIIGEKDYNFDIICCAVGTGGTISGISNGSYKHQRIIGFPALKGSFLSEEIKKYTKYSNWDLLNKYHFNGYGKINLELIEFINTFKKEQNIPLDPIYTGKMMYGIFDMIKEGVFTKNTRILAVHTGGLQGIAGMNKKLEKKNFPLITI